MSMQCMDNSILVKHTLIDNLSQLLSHYWSLSLWLGTHYIQDINVTSSDIEPGQIDVSCKFLVNRSIAVGYLTIIYSLNGDIHYLIMETSDKEYVTSMLTGLISEEYLVLLYTINETGLPLEQPAGFPQTVLVDNQLNYSGMYITCFVEYLHEVVSLYYVIVINWKSRNYGSLKRTDPKGAAQGRGLFT